MTQDDWRIRGTLSVTWSNGRAGFFFFFGLLPADFGEVGWRGRFFASGLFLDADGPFGRVPWDDRFVPAPAWCYAAFEAGEPVEPILDHLAELHAAAKPWLAAAISAVYSGALT